MAFYEKEDIEMLIDNANIEEVLEACGMTKTKGKFMCINPEHHDTNPSMSNKKGSNFCYCFACGYSANAIKVLQNTQGLSFIDAVERLYEIEGCPGWFKNKQKQKSAIKPALLLTQAEKKLLQLHLPGKIYSPIGITTDSQMKDNSFRLQWIPTKGIEKYSTVEKGIYIPDLLPDKLFIQIALKKVKLLLSENEERGKLLKNASAEELYTFFKKAVPKNQCLAVREMIISESRQEWKKLRQLQVKIEKAAKEYS